MWLKIDTGFARHPKVLRLTERQRWVHVSAMCWCAENATDGAIPREALEAISPHAKGAAKRLVEVGVWDETPDGYAVHDWLDYNISAEDHRKQRDAKAARQAAWRAKRDAAKTGDVDGLQDSRGDSRETRSGRRSTRQSPRARAETRPDPTPSPTGEGRVRSAAPEPEPLAQAAPTSAPPTITANGNGTAAAQEADLRPIHELAAEHLPECVRIARGQHLRAIDGGAGA